MFLAAAAAVSAAALSCGSGGAGGSAVPKPVAGAAGAAAISPGDDPNFRITAVADPGLAAFHRQVEVFGIPILAFEQVEDRKLLHAARLMARYLDNDEDGEPDQPEVVEAMREADAFLAMWSRQSDLLRLPESLAAVGQDLGNDETRPEWHENGRTGPFDAAIEEVLHLITFVGYARVWPEAFGISRESRLAEAMDRARGGRFERVPDSWPEGAWFTYDDTTCDYECMLVEYLYWALTSLLGAQENRAPEIGREWRLHTRGLLMSGDPAVFELLTDPRYRIPTVLPDGKYRGG